MTELEWPKAGQINSLSFTCGWCGREVASNHGWEAVERVPHYTDTVLASIAVCHRCTLPTVYIPRGSLTYTDVQRPAPAPGRDVEHLPDAVGAIYEEARQACGAGAWTAAAMALRAVISYVAADRGAPKSTFKQYVEWLDDNGYLPPGGSIWVTRIKDTGNDAAHELTPLESDEVTLVLDFTELLLRFVYEAPGRLTKDAVPLADPQADSDPS